MTEETENIVLEILRKVRNSQERMEQGISDLKIRMSSVETMLGQQLIQFATLNTRIEQRLDLVNV